MEINNLPKNVNDYRYIVAMAVDGALWFYGAWKGNRKAEAEEQARKVNGFVVENFSAT